MGFVAMATYPVQLCKLIALCTANAYSAECEMSVNACTYSMAHLVTSVDYWPVTVK